MLTFLTSCGQSPVDIVKDGVLDSCPTKTIGEMVSSELIMNSPSWEYFKADDGMTYVNLEGLVEYEAVSNVLVQFIIKKDKEAKDLEQRHLIQHRHWNRRSGGSVTIKKDKKFDLLKRKLGGA